MEGLVRAGAPPCREVRVESRGSNNCMPCLCPMQPGIVGSLRVAHGLGKCLQAPQLAKPKPIATIEAKVLWLNLPLSRLSQWRWIEVAN